MKDFAVDGLVNHISEFNAVTETEGPHNPSGNAFYYVENLLDSEQKVCLLFIFEYEGLSFKGI